MPKLRYIEGHVLYILSCIWPCDDPETSCEGYVTIFKWKIPFFITHSCNWHSDVFKTLLSPVFRTIRYRDMNHKIRCDHVAAISVIRCIPRGHIKMFFYNATTGMALSKHKVTLSQCLANIALSNSKIHVTIADAKSTSLQYYISKPLKCRQQEYAIKEGDNHLKIFISTSLEITRKLNVVQFL